MSFELRGFGIKPTSNNTIRYKKKNLVTVYIVDSDKIINLFSNIKIMGFLASEGESLTGLLCPHRASLATCSSCGGSVAVGALSFGRPL